MKACLAMRFSTSIPLVSSVKAFGKHLMVDGSLLSKDALHRIWAMEAHRYCAFVCAVNEYDELKTDELFPIVNYLRLLIRAFMTNISREYINHTFWHNTIIINTGLCSAVDFGISEEKNFHFFNIDYENCAH
jgi:NTE family protein